LSTQGIPTGFARAWAFIRANGAGAGAEILINFILPFVIYQFTNRAIGDFDALLCASAPPIFWSLLEFFRRRRIDVLSLFVLTGIVLSMLAFVGGGSVRLLQLRENLATAVIGVIFLGSAAIGKPLVYQLARAKYLRDFPAEADALEALGQDAQARRTMMVITIVCGIGLVASALFASALVFVLSISTYLLIGPIVGYGTMGVLCVWAYWYSQRQEGDDPVHEDMKDGSESSGTGG
jgi:hypothetical protein